MSSDDRTPRHAPGPVPALVEVDAATTAVIRGEVAMHDMPAFFDRTFTTLPAVLGAQGVGIAGPAFALHHRRPGATADLEVGFPTETQVDPTDDVTVGELPSGRVARLVHRGAYDDLPAAWARLEAWIADQGLTPAERLWEVYLTEPTPDMDPADLQTELNWPIAS